jgi:hypothetical protein
MQADPDKSQGWKGAALIGLTINHLVLWPLPHAAGLLRFTYGSLGWFTFASIFFGIAGYQWGKKASQSSMSEIWSWNKARALRLYLWFVAVASLLILGMTLEVIRPAPWQRHLDWTGPNSFFLCAVGLKIPWLSDVLWLHAWLGLFASFLWTCPYLMGKTGRIAPVSFMFWLTGQLEWPSAKFMVGSAPSWHAWTCWQFVFVLSALFAKSEFLEWKERLEKAQGRAVILIFLLTCFLMRHLLPQQSLSGLTHANTLAPLFALNSFLVLLFGKSFSLRLPPILANLGSQSLSVYAFQCIWIYVLGSWLDGVSLIPAATVFWLSISAGLLFVVSGISFGWGRTCRRKLPFESR